MMTSTFRPESARANFVSDFIMYETGTFAEGGGFFNFNPAGLGTIPLASNELISIPLDANLCDKTVWFYFTPIFGSAANSAGIMDLMWEFYKDGKSMLKLPMYHDSRPGSLQPIKVRLPCNWINERASPMGIYLQEKTVCFDIAANGTQAVNGWKMLIYADRLALRKNDDAGRGWNPANTVINRDDIQVGLACYEQVAIA